MDFPKDEKFNEFHQLRKDDDIFANQYSEDDYEEWLEDHELKSKEQNNAK